MPQPNANLAESLEVLASLQSTGRRVFATSELSRTHRDRLKAAGFLRPVIKGWWMATDPAALPGDTTAWHACFWEFCGQYCEARFGEDWHLSPELSILLHAEATDVPRQVVVHTPGGSNNSIELPFGTSLFDYGVDSLPDDAQRTERRGVRLLTLPASLVRAQPSFFEQRPVEAQVALSRIRDASDLLAVLLEGDHVVAGGRLAGAQRRLGRPDMAEEIAGTMSRAGHRVRESDPFQPDRPLREIGPRTPAIVARLQGLWQAMRGPIEEAFPGPPDRLPRRCIWSGWGPCTTRTPTTPSPSRATGSRPTSSSGSAPGPGILGRIQPTATAAMPSRPGGTGSLSKA